MTVVEVCAGSIEDCLIAQKEGARFYSWNYLLRNQSVTLFGRL